MFPSNNSPSEEGITISKRQASILIALFLLLALSVFIIGYFLGKKSMLDTLGGNFEQEIEKLDQSAVKISTEDDALDGVPDISLVTKDFAFDDAQNDDFQDKKEEEKEIVVAVKSEIIKESKTPISETPVKVYAQLIGFGSKQSAATFQNRLKVNNVNVIIKTRSSRTAKGRKRLWYQAVTPVFSSFEELEKVVKKIQKLEFLRTNDINIVHIKEQEDQV